jgi:hypothetical protein
LFAADLNEPDRDLTLRAVLDRASRLLHTSLAEQPMVAASLHATIGRAYRNLGLSRAINCKAYDLFLEPRASESACGR